MHQLRIIFTCICAYLPRKDDVLVVIPDGRKGHGGHAGHGGGHEGPQATAAIPPHVPIIEFDPADLSPHSEVQPDLLFSRPGARRNLGLVFLTGQDITLDPAPSGTPAIRGGRVPEHKVPETPSEAEDFTWIADVGKLDPAAGVMRPECVEPGTSADDHVVARMSLQGGTVAAQLLGREQNSENHELIRFNFVDATALANTHPSYEQALAAGVAYEVTVLSEEVALVLKTFDNGPTRRLDFSFNGIPTGGTVQILIKNMPLENVLELTNLINPDLDEPAAVDAHFAMYYSLSNANPQTPWIPNSPKARFGGPICPGARFTG
jgi:hypothetical protein